MHDFLRIAEYKKANYVMIQLESSVCNHEFYQESFKQMSLYTSRLTGKHQKERGPFLVASPSAVDFAWLPDDKSYEQISISSNQAMGKNLIQDKWIKCIF